MDGDIENRMNFMVQQQAQFRVDLQALEGTLAEIATRQETNLQQIEANRGMIRQLVDVSMSLANSIQNLGTDTDRRIKELHEAGAHTDRRLDALINVVDKLTRRNGGAS